MISILNWTEPVPALIAVWPADKADLKNYPVSKILQYGFPFVVRQAHHERKIKVLRRLCPRKNIKGGGHKYCSYAFWVKLRFVGDIHPKLRLTLFKLRHTMPLCQPQSRIIYASAPFHFWQSMRYSFFRHFVFQDAAKISLYMFT